MKGTCAYRENEGGGDKEGPEMERLLTHISERLAVLILVRRS
jgi:hypothetical protein